MTKITHYQALPCYVTKDDSTIRELMHPEHHSSRLQSLAEATIAPGGRTLLHRHARSEELYHITDGKGVMILGSERFRVAAGDTVCIPPGTAHAVENTGEVTLTILCCCTPPYAHSDTELLENTPN